MTVNHAGGRNSGGRWQVLGSPDHLGRSWISFWSPTSSTKGHIQRYRSQLCSWLRFVPLKMSFLNFSAMSLLLVDNETLFSLLLCLPPGKHGGETPFISGVYCEMRPQDTQDLKSGSLADWIERISLMVTGCFLNRWGICMDWAGQCGIQVPPHTHLEHPWPACTWDAEWLWDTRDWWHLLERTNCNWQKLGGITLLHLNLSLFTTYSI